MALEQLAGGAAQQVDLVAVRRLDERGARREVTVERADADAGAPRDVLQRGVRAVLGECLDRRPEQLLAVAPRVGAQRAFGGHNRRNPPDLVRSSMETEDTSDSLDQRSTMTTKTYGFESTA